MTLSNEKAVLYLQAIAMLHNDASRKAWETRRRLWSLLETNATVREMFNRPPDRLLVDVAATYTPTDIREVADAIRDTGGVTA